MTPTRRQPSPPPARIQKPTPPPAPPRAAGDQRTTKDIQLGSTFRDRITGFTGVAVGHVFYITGCNQTLLSPPVKTDGSHQDSAWFDDQRLERTDAPVITLDNGSTPGCDMPAPIR